MSLRKGADKMKRSIKAGADVLLSDPSLLGELGRFSSVGLVTNPTGITKDALLIGMKNEDLDAVLDVNLKGSFYMMRGAAKRMLRKRAGRIINISSVAGVLGNAGQVNYAASKAAVIGMTKSLAREVASRSITVNAVAPGMIRTDMTAALPDQAREKLEAGIPLGRAGAPRDVAEDGGMTI